MTVWWLVLASAAVLLVSVLYFRAHALLALLGAGFMVAALTPSASLHSFAESQVVAGKLSEKQSVALEKASPAQRLAEAFGETAGQVGIMIALASVIGICLMESGGAYVIIDAMLRICGVDRTPHALAASAFLLSIPVYFDTVFYLMVPLARSFRQRSGKHYIYSILAIMAGGSIAHSLVPPTPGPLQVAEMLHIDLATMMIAGLVIGSCSSSVSLIAAKYLGRWTEIPLRETSTESSTETSEPMAVASRPPLWLALAPIIIPVVLISLGAIQDAIAFTSSPAITRAIEQLADKNLAMGIACVVSLYLLTYAPKSFDRSSGITRAISSGGQIILITSAGGAFGSMLRQAGIASAVSETFGEVSGVWVLVMAFLVTAGIRTLQGSATVSMITAGGILQGFAEAPDLPFHPVYLAMAIGAGSKPIAWMNDSGFWIMCKMSGMTESEGLRTVSPLTIAMGISALFWTVLFSVIWPGI